LTTPTDEGDSNSYNRVMAPETKNSSVRCQGRQIVVGLLLGWLGQLVVLIMLVLGLRAEGARVLSAGKIAAVWAMGLGAYWAVTMGTECLLLWLGASHAPRSPLRAARILPRVAWDALADLLVILALTAVAIAPRAWLAVWVWGPALALLLPGIGSVASRLSLSARSVARSSRRAGDGEYPETRSFMDLQDARDLEFRLLEGDASIRSPIVYLPYHRPPLVCLSESVLRCLAPAERVAVLAHELAHHRLHHGPIGTRRNAAVWVLAALSAQVVLNGTFGAVGVAQVLASFAPALLLVRVVLLLARPILLALNRRDESRAHALAMELTDAPDVYLSAVRMVGAASESTDTPGLMNQLLVNTHPTLEEVAEQARCLSECGKAEQGPRS
jgi:Zn-dependent protease with chaperone function